MSNDTKTIEEFRANTLAGYVKWYWEDGERIQRKYINFFWVGIICSVSATIFAAFPRSIAEKVFAGGADLLGWIVVVLTASATVASSTLVPRYKRMLDDRDKGRIRLDALSMRMQLRDYPEEVRSDLDAAIREIAAVEGDFGTLDKAAEKRDGSSA